jgi:hypothetical protein
VIHGELACLVSLNDIRNRQSLVVGDQPHDIGGHRPRFIPTPHVPHNWEAGLWFDETTATLLAGNLLSQVGNPPALCESDLVEPAIATEKLFRSTGLTTTLSPVLHQLADLQPKTPAVMHGALFTGDGAAQLRGLADGYAALADGYAAMG